jgi:hypothetical protein
VAALKPFILNGVKEFRSVETNFDLNSGDSLNY